MGSETEHYKFTSLTGCREISGNFDMSVLLLQQSSC